MQLRVVISGRHCSFCLLLNFEKSENFIFWERRYDEFLVGKDKLNFDKTFCDLCKFIKFTS